MLSEPKSPGPSMTKGKNSLKSNSKFRGSIIFDEPQRLRSMVLSKKASISKIDAMLGSSSPKSPSRKDKSFFAERDIAVAVLEREKINYIRKNMAKVSIMSKDNNFRNSEGPMLNI